MFPNNKNALEKLFLVPYDVWQTALALLEPNVWKDTTQIYEHLVLSEIWPNIDSVHCCFRSY